MYHVFDVVELEYFLQFQNPLEIVADTCYERNVDADDLCYTMENIKENREMFMEIYPLVETAEITELNTSEPTVETKELTGLIDNTLIYSTEHVSPVDHEISEGTAAYDDNTVVYGAVAPQKKPSLADKLQAANEKVKAQEKSENNTKTNKIEERS